MFEPASDGVDESGDVVDTRRARETGPSGLGRRMTGREAHIPTLVDLVASFGICNDEQDVSIASQTSPGPHGGSDQAGNASGDAPGERVAARLGHAPAHH